MAEVENLVKSEAFPNLQVSEKYQVKFDKILNEVKEYSDTHPNDQGVKEFVDKVGKLDGYTIHDGSFDDKDCSGEHNGKQKNINIPFTLAKSEGGTGYYHGADAQSHDLTLPRALVHELAHATNMDRQLTPISGNGIKELLKLESEQNNLIHELKKHVLPREAASLPQFPSTALHEAGAVEVENYIAKQVFHDHDPRMNVGDKDGVYTSENLKDWYKDEYHIHGKCVNGQSLQKEKASDLEQHSHLVNELTPVQKVGLVAQFIESLPEHQREPYQQMVAQYANEKGLSIDSQVATKYQELA
jgi:hypothetical protein